jgi:CMP-N-acetylneuraminic acid synthetase
MEFFVISLNISSIFTTKSTPSICTCMLYEHKPYLIFASMSNSFESMKEFLASFLMNDKFLRKAYEHFCSLLLSSSYVLELSDCFFFFFLNSFNAFFFLSPPSIPWDHGPCWLSWVTWIHDPFSSSPTGP